VTWRLHLTALAVSAALALPAMLVEARQIRLPPFLLR
jgi:hypothetical protein